MRRARTYKLIKYCCVILTLMTMLQGCKKEHFYVHQGYIFGTTYNIRYHGEKNLEQEILLALREMDNSLSMFNDSSIITRINRNEPVQTDSLFETMYETAYKVSEISQGAFDITVRPLVNAWGFGNSHGKTTATETEIDSIRTFVGYTKIALQEHILVKQDLRTTLDASAIAKGFGVDIAAEILRQSGCKNYLVDIGGEVVAKGYSQQGKAWRIGINKPDDDPQGTNRELQEIIESTDIAMATSGNYRQFYFDGEVRRSHTIDPRSGYPVSHRLLSATITARSCIMADALATASMVLGEEKAMQMIDAIQDAEYYFILGSKNGYEVKKSLNWGKKNIK